MSVYNATAISGGVVSVPYLVGVVVMPALPKPGIRYRMQGYAPELGQFVHWVATDPKATPTTTQPAAVIVNLTQIALVKLVP